MNHSVGENYADASWNQTRAVNIALRIHGSQRPRLTIKRPLTMGETLGTGITWPVSVVIATSKKQPEENVFTGATRTEYLATLTIHGIRHE